MSRRPPPKAPYQPRTKALEDTMTLVTAAGTTGISASDAARARGIDIKTAYSFLMRMVGMGLIGFHQWGDAQRRYYAPQHHPRAPGNGPACAAAVEALRAARTTQARGNALRVKTSATAGHVDFDAPAIVPPGLKVTICPAGRDFRFTADPSLAGHGAITQDWRARRLAEQRNTGKR